MEETPYKVLRHLIWSALCIKIMEVIMIYHFTYKLKLDSTRTKVCITLREAEIFFDILLSAGCDYIRVVTTPRRSRYDKK